MDKETADALANLNERFDAQQRTIDAQGEALARLTAAYEKNADVSALEKVDALAKRIFGDNA